MARLRYNKQFKVWQQSRTTIETPIKREGLRKGALPFFPQHLCFGSPFLRPCGCYRRILRNWISTAASATGMGGCRWCSPLRRPQIGFWTGQKSISGRNTKINFEATNWFLDRPKGNFWTKYQNQFRGHTLVFGCVA